MTMISGLFLGIFELELLYNNRIQLYLLSVYDLKWRVRQFSSRQFQCIFIDIEVFFLTMFCNQDDQILISSHDVGESFNFYFKTNFTSICFCFSIMDNNESSCFFCPEKFNTIEELNQHVINNHQIMIQQVVWVLLSFHVQG